MASQIDELISRIRELQEELRRNSGDTIPNSLSTPLSRLFKTRSSAFPSPTAPVASSYNVNRFLANSSRQPPDKNRVNHMPYAISVFFNVVEQFQLFE